MTIKIVLQCPLMLIVIASSSDIFLLLMTINIFSLTKMNIHRICLDNPSTSVDTIFLCREPLFFFFFFANSSLHRLILTRFARPKFQFSFCSRLTSNTRYTGITIDFCHGAANTISIYVVLNPKKERKKVIFTIFIPH